MALACEMIEPRHGTIVDIERKSPFDLAAKRKTDGRLDRAAVADGNDVVTGLFGCDALDRGPGTVVEVHETFAAGRGLVDIGKPVAADRPAGQECGTIHPLQLAKVLLGEGGFLRHRRRLWKPR